MSLSDFSRVVYAIYQILNFSFPVFGIDITIFDVVIGLTISFLAVDFVLEVLE